MTQLAELLVNMYLKERKELQKKASAVPRIKILEKADKMVDAEEIARILDVPVSWIYSRTRLGKDEIPYVKVGKYIRFNPHEAIEHFKRSTNSCNVHP